MMPVRSQPRFNTALIVEDLPEFSQWVAHTMLEVFPEIKLDRCYSVQQAHQLIRQQHYDLALVDLGLPDGNGIEIIQWFEHYAPDTMSIIMTIFDDDQHLLKAICHGAQGYLLKDLEPALFQQYLRQLSFDLPAFSPDITHKLLHYIRHNEQQKQQAVPGSFLPLTPREKEVFIHIASGARVSEIACTLGLSAYTVSGYIKEIYRKLNISSRVEAALFAQQHGLIKH